MLDTPFAPFVVPRQDLTLDVIDDREIRVVQIVGDVEAGDRPMLDGLRRAIGTAPALVLDLCGLRCGSPRSIWRLADWASATSARGVLVAVVGVDAELARLWLSTDLPLPQQYATVDAAVSQLTRRLQRTVGAPTPSGVEPELSPLAVLEREVLCLRQAMESRAMIEQAKGMIMARGACSAEEAFAVLTKRSQRTNRKVRDIAAEIVERAKPQGHSPGAA